MPDYKPNVSVVIPIYNVERYIERCLHSLFSQTLKNIEYIFVDDGSTDDSLLILNRVLRLYPERKNQVLIIKHKINKGVAASRTTGILATTGEYITHCDPDDYVDPTIYETLYDTAKSKKVDFVACDYFIESESAKRIVKTEYGSSHLSLLKKNRKNLGCCIVLWDKLVKRDIIFENKIFPFDGCNYGEDMGCVIRILCFAKSYYKINRPLYTYCERVGSITRKPISKDLSQQIIKSTLLMADFLNKHSYESMANHIKISTKINFRKILQISFDEWFNLFKESNNYVINFKELPFKARVCWWFALQNKTFFKIVENLIPSFRF